MQFDVYLPKAEGAQGDFHTLRVEADHWTNALKTGMAQIGENASGIDQAICTVRDDGWLQVNEAKGSRIFFVKEVEGTGQAAADDARGETSAASGGAQGQVRGTDAGQAAVGQVVESDSRTVAPKAIDTGAEKPLFEGHLGEIETTIAAYAKAAGHDMHRLANDVLALALHNVACEAGSVLFSHLNGQDLYFAAAHGPNSEKLVDMRIPGAKGIVGFCFSEGVCLGVTEVQRDPRFFGRISKSIGFDTRDILCAPVIDKGLVFGAVELINKRGGAFDRNDLNTLSFVGYQLARHLHDIFRA